MKKLICMLALLLGGVASANAQVYFDSGSAKPKNAGAATHKVVRHATVRHYVKVRPQLFRCRDGSRRPASQCVRHGGIARR